jgi:hypothetical protein
MWSDGCGVKASLQNCNIRFNRKFAATRVYLGMMNERKAIVDRLSKTRY